MPNQIGKEAGKEREKREEREKMVDFCISTPKIEDNLLLHKVVEDVVSVLDDKKIRIIGIWGFVGIGKTTIMQNLNNHKNILKMFDIVIWEIVLKEWSLKKL